LPAISVSGAPQRLLQQ